MKRPKEIEHLIIITSEISQSDLSKFFYVDQVKLLTKSNPVKALIGALLT